MRLGWYGSRRGQFPMELRCRSVEIVVLSIFPLQQDQDCAVVKRLPQGIASRLDDLEFSTIPSVSTVLI
jgi:hypothetical protein